MPSPPSRAPAIERSRWVAPASLPVARGARRGAGTAVACAQRACGPATGTEAGATRESGAAVPAWRSRPVTTIAGAMQARSGDLAHSDAVPAPVPFADAFRFWVKLGFISFGGPAGQIAIMHRELVDRRRWISEERFLHALNYCMLLPGPEAQQLAIYIGWLMHRTLGGIVAGAFFVIPSIFVLLALSYTYAAYGNLPAVAGVLSGFKPIVVAI